jgi:hypothetical protein
MTPFSAVYDRFLKKVEDVDLPNFSDLEQQAILYGYLESAIAYVEMDQIEFENSLDNIEDELMFEADLSVGEMEVLSMYMVVAWYDPKINSVELTLFLVASSGEKWQSKKEYLDSLIQAREYWRLEARNYMKRKAYKKNSYLDG